MMVDRVKGYSKVFGLIATPIEHTFSPIIHNTIAKGLKHERVYVPFLVQRDTVQEAFALNIQGLNVTMPHKSEVISQNASKIYIVNCTAEKSLTLAKNAKQFSLHCMNGFEMLLHQAFCFYEIWNNISIESETKQKICKVYAR